MLENSEVGIQTGHSLELLFLGGGGCGCFPSHLDAVQLGIGHFMGDLRVSFLEGERVGMGIWVKCVKDSGPASDETHLPVPKPVLSCGSYAQVLEWP